MAAGILPSQIISAEKLSSGQSELAQQYIALARARGVLVGALVGSAPWDIRPVLLLGGQLTVLRLTDPAFVGETAAWKWLREFHTALSLIQKLPGLIARGEAAGQLWMHRVYFQNLLETGGAQRAASGSANRTDAARNLAELIFSLHKRGLFHGHICPSNVAWDGASLTLLDYGFMLASKSPESRRGNATAPEYRNLPGVVEPSGPADVYGLTQVLRLLDLKGVGSYQRELLDAGASAEPDQRPELLEIVRSFAHSSGAKDIFGAPRGPATTGIRSGRLISDVPIVPEPPPEPPPVPRREEPREDPSADATVVIKPPPRRESAPPPPPPGTPEKKKKPKPDGAAASPAAKQDWVHWALLSALAGLVGVFTFSYIREREDGDVSAWEDAWESGQPSQMEEVADAAVLEGNKRAQSIIVGDALKGNARPRVRADIIRFAFNPMWEAELSEADRKLVLQFALSGLVPLGDDVPPLADVHPAVVTAIAGNVNYDVGAQALGRVPLTAMADLGGQGGRAYAELNKILPGATMNLPAARALAHILRGDVTDDALGAYFGSPPEGGDHLVLDKLRVILLLMGGVPSLEEPLYEYMYDSGGAVSARLAWFDAAEVGLWENIPHRMKLLMAASVLPESGLAFEHYADLLTFPRAGESAHANRAFYKAIYKRVLDEFGDKAGLASTLKFLVGGQHQFTRTQVISLLAGLRAKGEDSYSLIGIWFKTKPVPEDVVGLLLARADRPADDPFNGEAASYLSRSDWRPTLDHLNAMIRHPVKLLRAIAYARLDPSVPEEADLLLAAATQEPSEELKTQILSKLETARERHSGDARPPKVEGEEAAPIKKKEKASKKK